MSYVSPRSNIFQTLLTEQWHRWQAAYDRAVTQYYNRRIELDPEGEAWQYWQRLKQPQSGINVCEISDAMLSRLMNTLLQQGISKFAVDCFILELRRLKRNVQG
jgi:hypothetical protein